MKMSHLLSLLPSAAAVRSMAFCALFVIGGALALAGPAAAQTPDGETPADEVFCSTNFDGPLNGLCNAFCEAMDCDSLDAKASLHACLQLEDMIQPLLDEYNTDFGTNLEIFTADAMISKPGHCGDGTPPGFCEPGGACEKTCAERGQTVGFCRAGMPPLCGCNAN